MALAELCTTANFKWNSELYDVFVYMNNAGVEKNIFRYRIPFSPEQEAIFLARYGMSSGERLNFYQQLALCIQRQIKVSEFLITNQVSSILRYTATEQVRDGTGTTYIYLETERVQPILQALFSPSVPAITVIDSVLRLATIIRDINKVDVVHRGFDMREVFLTADNKIMLSGFYYSECPGLGEYPSYLPVKPNNLPMVFQQGSRGHQGTDIQTLTICAWNLFSGHPYNALLQRSRMVFPYYATEEITEALLYGLSGNEETCNVFRRKLLNARKSLNKTDYVDVLIPYREALRKSFVIDYE